MREVYSSEWSCFGSGLGLIRVRVRIVDVRVWGLIRVRVTLISGQCHVCFKGLFGSGCVRARLFRVRSELFTVRVTSVYCHG